MAAAVQMNAREPLRHAQYISFIFFSFQSSHPSAFFFSTTLSRVEHCTETRLFTAGDLVETP
jgi:hypothetical protein